MHTMDLAVVFLHFVYVHVSSVSCASHVFVPITPFPTPRGIIVEKTRQPHFPALLHVHHHRQPATPTRKQYASYIIVCPAYPHPYPQTLSPPFESHDARVLGILRHQSHPVAATPWVCKTVATADDDDDGDDPAPLLLLLLAAMSHTYTFPLADAAAA